MLSQVAFCESFCSSYGLALQQAPTNIYILGMSEVRQNTNSHYPFLDGVRGLAALSVVFFHVADSDRLPEVEGGIAGFVWNTLFLNGLLGVAVFFVLSGFVISHSLRRGLETGGNFGDFMVRRLVRLTPPYWAAIIFAIGFHMLAVYVNGEEFAPGGEALTAPRFIHHFFYTQELAGFVNINDVFWTLALELQFYIVIGLIVLLITGLSRHVNVKLFDIAAWLLAGSSLAFAFFHSDPNRATTVGPFLYSFVIGVLINWYWRKQIHFSVLTIFLAGAGVLGFVAKDAAFARAAFVSGLLLLVALKTGGVNTWLSRPVFEFLGKISYSLYLIHVPIVGACLLVATQLFGTGAAGYWIGTSTAVVGSVVASMVFWWLVERPSLQWLSSRRKAAPPKTSGSHELSGQNS